MNNEFVAWHLLESLRAAKAEVDNDTAESRRLQAQAKLRFINMNDDELWELATVSASPRRPVDFVFLDLLRDRERLTANAEDWAPDIIGDAHSPCLAS